MQPIGSYRTPDPLCDPPSGPPDDPPAAPERPPPLDASLMVGPDPGFRLTSPMSKAAAAQVVRRRERDRTIQRGLDAFRAAMAPNYRTPEGPTCVAAPFTMSSHYRNQAAALDAGARAHLAPAAAGAGITTPTLAQIIAARGRPEDIQKFTQALIDRGYLSIDSSVPLWARVRSMMFNHGVGIDCAGYSQWAYLGATGRTRDSAGFKDQPINESLEGLRGRRYARVSAIHDVRPGDLGVLGAPEPKSVGHRVIVYDQHPATAADMCDLLDRGGPASAFAVGGPVLVLTVDSSWGCGDPNQNGDPLGGGVARTTWWYNESTGVWAWTVPVASSGGALVTGPRVYEHPLEGFYRRRDSESVELPRVKP